MSDRFDDQIEAVARRFIAPLSPDDSGEDPAGLRPYETATELRSAAGVPARLGDLLMLELEARALAPLFAVVGDLPESEVIQGVSVRYWVFAHAAEQRAITFGDVREDELLGTAVEAGADRLRRFYVDLLERIVLRGYPDDDPDDALDPEAVEILGRMRDHVERRVGSFINPPSEGYLDPEEDMSHVAAFYESDDDAEPTA